MYPNPAACPEIQYAQNQADNSVEMQQLKEKYMPALDAVNQAIGKVGVYVGAHDGARYVSSCSVYCVSINVVLHTLTLMVVVFCRALQTYNFDADLFDLFVRPHAAAGVGAGFCV